MPVEELLASQTADPPTRPRTACQATNDKPSSAHRWRIDEMSESTGNVQNTRPVDLPAPSVIGQYTELLPQARPSKRPSFGATPVNRSSPPRLDRQPVHPNASGSRAYAIYGRFRYSPILGNLEIRVRIDCTNDRSCGRGLAAKIPSINVVYAV